ncbi:hypothetical protein GCM10017771_86510 [Streptomyces capitiformicae]|uniref:Uncharacterized protein n=1 Tax=Streptomyces capitiformicae TaxID=2014920 RepID=A0A918ZQA0_9ACTN|nr:hypothetical protein GCM10017771_86510 [Streptomyces capitiformicae]
MEVKLQGAVVVHLGSGEGGPWDGVGAQGVDDDQCGLVQDDLAGGDSAQDCCQGQVDGDSLPAHSEAVHRGDLPDGRPHSDAENCYVVLHR